MSEYAPFRPDFDPKTEENCVKPFRDSQKWFRNRTSMERCVAVKFYAELTFVVGSAIIRRNARSDNPFIWFRNHIRAFRRFFVHFSACRLIVPYKIGMVYAMGATSNQNPAFDCIICVSCLHLAKSLDWVATNTKISFMCPSISAREVDMSRRRPRNTAPSSTDQTADGKPPQISSTRAQRNADPRSPTARPSLSAPSSASSNGVLMIVDLPRGFILFARCISSFVR